MSLEASLLSHQPSDAREADDLRRMLDFVRRHPNAFDRSIVEGHFTGSGLVVSSGADHVLLLHHAKLHRWLQPGGHGETGEVTGEAVASREVLEETGLVPRLHPSAPRPFDVDIHVIPARGSDAAHEHLDVRYLFVADPGEALRGEAAEIPAGVEGPPLRWFSTEEALGMDLDPGLKRMIRKARDLQAVPD
jgi:8-oxo-dGTP pyrophosphatase MutT (NUDIX family)